MHVTRGVNVVRPFSGVFFLVKGVPYFKRFAMPNNGIWYSMDYPLVHIVVTLYDNVTVKSIIGNEQ
jgi:hypothetical protein